MELHTTENKSSVMESTTTPHWYLVLDGLTLTSSAIGTLVSILFVLTVIVSRRERHSITNLIACNTQLPIFCLSAVTVYSMATVLNSDLHHVTAFDSLCIWRSYFVYTEIATIYYSFVTQSYYRYMRVMRPTQPRYSSVTTLCIIMATQWIIIHGIMLFLPLSGLIEFEAGRQMCSVLLIRYWVIWLLAVLIYLPPFNIITFVYIRLAIFSKQSRTRAASTSFQNACRELEMIKRMFLVLFIFCVSATPYSIYSILALIDKRLLPVYYYRIIACFNAFALAIASSTLLLQSKGVRQTIIGFIMMRNNHRVQPLHVPHLRVHVLVK